MKLNAVVEKHYFIEFDCYACLLSCEVGITLISVAYVSRADEHTLCSYITSPYCVADVNSAYVAMYFSLKYATDSSIRGIQALVFVQIEPISINFTSPVLGSSKYVYYIWNKKFGITSADSSVSGAVSDK